MKGSETMATRRGKTPKERKIVAPILALNVDEEIRGLKFEPEWVSGVEDGITLVKYPHMRIVLIALRKGKSMHEHKVNGPISLFVVSGKISLIAGKSETQLKARGLFTLRKAIPHDVRALVDSVVILTIVAL
jgi:quercetin dioxygenase-like cupin family protein